MNLGASWAGKDFILVLWDVLVVIQPMLNA
jgi:hypothetical protein